jgi:hypothetical protein
MAPAPIVFPDPLFLLQTPDGNDEQRFHCNSVCVNTRGSLALLKELVSVSVCVGERAY